MTSLTFTQALLLFTLTQILLYFLILRITDRSSIKEHYRYSSFEALTIYSDKISLILSSVGLLLTLLTNFRETIPYFILLSLILFLNAINVALGKTSGLMLSSLILWHLMIYSDKSPAIDIAVGEGSAMVREMRLNDHWRFEWAHNPNYNPLPTVAFIQATISRVADMSWYSYGLGQVMMLVRLVVYDITIYTLTYTITRDRSSALISIPLVAITPETAIHQHPYQWSGNALVLIATIMTINIVKLKRPHINLVTIILLFTGAILTHATSLSYVFLLIPLLLVKIFSVKLKKLKTTLDIMWLTYILAALLIVLMLRSVYTYGYSEYVLPVIMNVLHGLINFIKEFFMSSEDVGKVIHISLYERAGVPRIQAYVWSYAMSLATAYMLYSLIKGRISLIELVLYSTSVGYLSIAYVGYGLLKMVEFHWLNVTSYVFVPFIYPLAAKALTKVFRGLPYVNVRLNLAIALLGITLLTIAAPIAARDPNISPIQYAKVREAPMIDLTIADLAKANIFMGKVEARINTYFIIQSESSFIKKIVHTGRGGIVEYVLSSKLVEAINLYSSIHKISIPRITVINSLNNTSTYNLLVNFGEEKVLNG